MARARDLVEGRIGVIVCAREMSKLAFWLREQNDPSFATFRGIDSESDTLPAGPERQYWSESALREEDEKIRVAEDLWRTVAMEAARALMEKYRASADEHT
ncbi:MULTISPECIES: hypothetical protein [Nitrosomonas]|uniref:hypothetical protein n=1 Tax=Nitrosomonas TaxID=914 RepID=UPI0019361D42|nr:MULTISPECIES: hypothetical protein [Nitrosomonas]QOJ10048.1 MAG: hypothetical protein HRU73_11775 [Nitrosomonas sp. H1_AOB3]HRN82095.1 hypothetical protein [Nitrosomonas europaea]HRO56090.1 hypothetical protein [Nitrosomonas europaea]HRQ08165.1 hypothetical protein [Nitrosomonas europaea]HUM73708.1 hypothetical protein [Nitrosomonas europaea]